jgi:hypothetical protein
VLERLNAFAASQAGNAIDETKLHAWTRGGERILDGSRNAFERTRGRILQF